MAEDTTIAERYGGATQSGNLLMRGGLDDATWLAAAGMVGMKDPLPSAVARMMSSGRQSDYADVRSILQKRIGGWSDRRLNRGNEIGPPTEVEAALAWWINPTCSACEGRCYETIPGAPTLSDVPCKVCEGTGRRKLHRTAVVNDCLSALDNTRDWAMRLASRIFP